MLSTKTVGTAFIITCLVATQVPAMEKKEDRNPGKILNRFLIPELCKLSEDYQEFETAFSLVGHERPITSIVYRHDGAQIASASSVDYRARLWDPTTKKEEAQYKAGTVAYSPDGLQAALAGEDRCIYLLDVAEKKFEQTPNFRHDSEVASIAYNPRNGKQLMSTDCLETAYILSIPEGKQIFKSERYAANKAVYNHDGQHIALTKDNTIRILNIATSQVMQKFAIPKEIFVEPIAYSPNGKQVASGNSDSIIRIWDVLTGKVIRQFTDHKRPSRAITYSTDGNYLASAGMDQKVFIWDMRNHKVLQEILYDQIPHCLAFNPQDPYELTVANGSAIQVYKKLRLTS